MTENKSNATPTRPLQWVLIAGLVVIVALKYLGIVDLTHYVGLSKKPEPVVATVPANPPKEPVTTETHSSDIGNEEKETITSPTTSSPPNEEKANPVLKRLQSKELVFTRHANCRMECRTISEAEVKDILQEGEINARKSKPNDRPCPSYAIEGQTDDRQEVRIVFADCPQATKVITAIDLGKEYQCYCE